MDDSHAPNQDARQSTQLTVLLDMDGVLIDNVDFEVSVTLEIVEQLASHLRLDTEEAAAVWQARLAATARDAQWYDYDYHAGALGLIAPARQAHIRHAHRLVAIAGAKETLTTLAENSLLRVLIVSDALPWVVKHKLTAVGLYENVQVISSAKIGAPKNSTEFWRRIRRQLPRDVPCVYVDNRLDNLSTCAEVNPRFHLIHYEFDEHVSKMIDGPAYSGAALFGGRNGSFHTVTSQEQLLEKIKGLAFSAENG